MEMYSDDLDGIELGMEILARLHAEHGLPQLGQKTNEEESPAMERPASSEPYQALPVKSPALSDLLIEMSPLPDHTILVGACEDGLPVTLDLANPSAGGLLLLGDSSSGKTSLLKSILTSACAINTPRDVRFCCIASHSSGLEELYSYPHAYRTSLPYDRETTDIIAELVYLTDQRSYGKNWGGTVILAVDNLYELVQKLDDDSCRLLSWLIKQGAASQIWTIAGLNTAHFRRLPNNMVSNFQTWLVGAINPSTTGAFLAQDVLAAASALLPGRQFASYIEGSWIRFWIPALD
jgi:hypothetical protein